MNTPTGFLIDTYEGTKPAVQLAGQDGNAFAIIGRVAKAWTRLGRRDIAQEFRDRAISGDYSHLLLMAMEYTNEEATWDDGDTLTEDEQWCLGLIDGDEGEEDMRE